MKKILGFTASVLLATSLVATPVNAGTHSSIENVEDFKKGQPAISQKLESGEFDEWNEEVEPNNTFAQANLIPLGNFTLGTFKDKDKDYFKLEINGDKAVELELSLFPYDEETQMKMNVQLYDSEKQKVDGYDEDQNEYGFTGSYEVDPGVYYVEAADLDNLDNGEQYIFFPMIYEEEPIIERISGKDRYDTAAKIAIRRSAGYPTDNVILATGTDFPDALAGAPLALFMEAPILLTKKNELPKKTKWALDYLETEHVTILGGTGVVSKSIENDLKNKMGLEVERISGKNRYETAAAIAKELPRSDTAVVAYGRNFPDALSIAPVAAMNFMPVLLTEKEKLPAATSQALENYDSSFAIGGTGVIGSKVFKQLPNAERISGKDRYSTSLAIAESFELDRQFVNLATGTNFADALTGSVYGYGEPLLLTPKNQLNPEVKQFFKDNETYYFRIFGGTNAVSENVEADIWSLFE